MSSIATMCDVALASLEADNTQITDPALVQVGDQVITSCNELLTHHQIVAQLPCSVFYQYHLRCTIAGFSSVLLM